MSSIMFRDMHCPICRKTFEEAESTSMPFCSERCRTLDLGRWLDEVYSLPELPNPDADEVPPEPLDASSPASQPPGPTL